MAYVYRHIRLDKNEPFYIGVGNDSKFYRANNNKLRNKHWLNIASKTNYIVEILFDGLSYEDALKKEAEFIGIHGRKGLGTGTLVNQTDGGIGAKGFKHSLESRERKSAYMKLLSPQKGISPTPEVRKKISDANKGKKRTLSHKKKLSERNRICQYIKSDKCINARLAATIKPILQYDMAGNFIKEYPSLSEAARNFNGNVSTLSKCCLNKGRSKSCYGFVWRYKQGEIENKINFNIPNCHPKPILKYDLNGNFISEYDSMTSAAASVNSKSSSCIVLVCKKKLLTHKGFMWQYKNGDIQNKITSYKYL